ncbi:hypothetical protein RDI58_005568 [Solanum bulbocastanum]|uniref:Uncharacterized protein n=1 Tax=Solanum bulbocastanum TaxID=147425 RepID=A0AAN8U6R3_SOLBU
MELNNSNIEVLNDTPPPQVENMEPESYPYTFGIPYLNNNPNN